MDQEWWWWWNFSRASCSLWRPHGEGHREPRPSLKIRIFGLFRGQILSSRLVHSNEAICCFEKSDVWEKAEESERWFVKMTSATQMQVAALLVRFQCNHGCIFCHLKTWNLSLYIKCNIHSNKEKLWDRREKSARNQLCKTENLFSQFRDCVILFRNVPLSSARKNNIRFSKQINVNFHVCVKIPAKSWMQIKKVPKKWQTKKELIW